MAPSIPKAYGFVILVNVIGASFMLVTLSFKVGAARKEYKIDLPTMYATGKDKKSVTFNCIQRGHQQALETFSTVLACSLSPAPVDLSRLAVRFRVNDAAAGSVAGWSAVTAPLLAGAAVVAVSAVTATTTTTATKSLAAVAAVAAAVSVASVTISLVARWAALSAGRRRSARAEEEAEVEMRAAAAAAPSPSSAARAAAQARAAAVAPKPGVGFDAVHENKGEEEGEKKTAKNSPFRDVEEEEEGGSEGGSGGGTGGKPAAAALAPRRLPLSRPLLPPPRRRIAPLHRRALSSPSPARLVL